MLVAPMWPNDWQREGVSKSHGYFLPVCCLKCMPDTAMTVLLDADASENEYNDVMKQLSADPKFEHLKSLFKHNQLGPNEQAQIELAEAEDARHKVGWETWLSIVFVEQYHTLLAQYRYRTYGSHLLWMLCRLLAHL